MNNKQWIRLGTLLMAPLVIILLARPAFACGGLFCRNNPVDQNAERIIFTDNGDGTVTAIVQIQYTGFDEDFSWILPLPEPIGNEDIAVPETAVTAFTELELATNPVFIPPPTPQCAQRMLSVDMAEGAMPASGVSVYAEGEVGPYGFVVVGSENPDELVNWLIDNGYRVTPEMEPLIDVYVEEQFVFLAMRLAPEFGVQDIAPIAITYPSAAPMIPLRLTAVAANPDMAVITWFFADKQAVPANYGHFEIDDSEITFFTFGGNNYRQLMGEKANEINGQAFITEYAAPTSETDFVDPLLQELNGRHKYLTRLNTVISPEEMTVDPVFKFEDRANVFNIHDLSTSRGQYDCERDGSGGILSTVFGDNQSAGTDGNNSFGGRSFLGGLLVGLCCLGLLGLVIGGAFWLGRRSR